MTEEKLVIGTWLPVFPGFYGTYFDDDNVMTGELDYIRENVEPVELAEAMIDNIWISETYRTFSAEHQESVVKQCADIILNNLRNLGFIEDIEFEKIHSPREYNFSNDSGDIKATFSPANVEKIKTFLLDNRSEWEKYLKDNYTSYDGLMSWHSNSIYADEWMLDNALNDKHNAGAILNFICEQHNIDQWSLLDCIETRCFIDIDALKKECIVNGWYEPKRFCRDWLRTLRARLKKNYRFRSVTMLGFWTKQYIFETPKQRYIFAVSKQEVSNPAFIVKRFLKVFIFAKLAEEKKK